MTTSLNSRQGAELIEAQTGRRCSRQNLDTLCREGALQGSPCILRAKPLQVDADMLVSEYLARVAPHQAEARQPAAKRQAPAALVAAGDLAVSHGRLQPTEPAPPPRHPAQLPSDAPEGLPDYTVSRSRSEYEKANLLELERKTKEGLLLRREDVDLAWGGAVNITRTRLLGVPSTAKQRIPHLEVEEVELLTALIREALDELAAGEVKA